MKIKSVKPIGREKTLDLEVNHYLHQYYCNGLLTSNSHSVSYTYVSFREYWLKAHYDAEFNVALLNNTPLQKEKKGESIIAGYLTEMIKKGFTIHRPNINESERNFTLKSDTDIIWGLNWVKNLTDKSIFDIISDRELNGGFESVQDFYNRIGASVLNKRVLEGLVWSGALDDFIEDGSFENRFHLYNYIFKTLKKTSKVEPPKQSEEELIDREIDYITISFQEMQNFSKTRNDWEERTGIEIDHLFRVEDEGQYNCIGIVDKLENKKTKNGKDYVRITLRDETKILKMVYVWPWKCKGWDSVRKGMLIQASLNNDGNFIHLIGWTLITQSERQVAIEKQEKEEQEQVEKEKKAEEEVKNKEFIQNFKNIYSKWNTTFSAERKMDKNINQPWLEIKSKYDTYTILVYKFDEEKGIPRKDLIYMKDKFEAIYLVNGEEYLFDMRTFQDKMAKVKSHGDRKKYPKIPDDIEHQMSEQIIVNKLS